MNISQATPVPALSDDLIDLRRAAASAGDLSIARLDPGARPG